MAFAMMLGRLTPSRLTVDLISAWTMACIVLSCWLFCCVTSCRCRARMSFMMAACLATSGSYSASLKRFRLEEPEHMDEADDSGNAASTADSKGARPPSNTFLGLLGAGDGIPEDRECPWDDEAASSCGGAHPTSSWGSSIFQPAAAADTLYL